MCIDTVKTVFKFWHQPLSTTLFFSAISEGSDKTEWKRGFVWDFGACMSDSYQNLVN